MRKLLNSFTRFLQKELYHSGKYDHSVHALLCEQIAIARNKFIEDNQINNYEQLQKDFETLKNRNRILEILVKKFRPNSDEEIKDLNQVI